MKIMGEVGVGGLGGTRLEKLSTGSLPDRVYDALVDMLAWGDCPPGAHLSIDTLAQDLGVSPTPVREALARLETTGLVKRNARRGYRVANPLPPEELAELVDALLVVESGALRRSMRDLPALVESLESAVEAHRAAVAALLREGEDPSREARIACDAAAWLFHEAILEHCGNRFLTTVATDLSFRVHRMGQRLTGEEGRSRALAAQEKILTAVRTGDFDLVLPAMREHFADLAPDESADGHPHGAAAAR